jgi:hypothetical protein
MRKYSLLENINFFLPLRGSDCDPDDHGAQMNENNEDEDEEEYEIDRESSYNYSCNQHVYPAELK